VFHLPIKDLRGRGSSRVSETIPGKNLGRILSLEAEGTPQERVPGANWGRAILLSQKKGPAMGKVLYALRKGDGCSLNGFAARERPESVREKICQFALLKGLEEKRNGLTKNHQKQPSPICQNYETK